MSASHFLPTFNYINFNQKLTEYFDIHLIACPVFIHL